MWSASRRSAILVSILALSTDSRTQAKPRTPPASPPKAQACGPIADNTLKCPRFGFTYKVPFGWVDRSNEMQDEIPAASPDADRSSPAKSAKSETLLAVFERPPGAPGETINSAVIVAAEPLSSYHEIKQPSDYLGPISELAEQRGFKIVNEPYSFSIAAKQLVRGDFSKERGKLTMWQSSLVMIDKGYIVSFTFVAGSEDESQALIGNLSFAANARVKK